MAPILSVILYALTLAAGLALWRGVMWRPRPLPGVRRRRPLLLGHRGVRGPAPENTLAAFELAFEAGLDGIECDVQRSRDGRLVLYHDFELDGRRVVEQTLDELRARRPDIAELSALLALARRYPDTLLNLELKIDRLRSRGLEGDLAVAVREAGLEDRVLVSSFHPLALVRLMLAAPALRRGLLFAPDLPPALRGGRLAGWLHADAWHPHHSQVDGPLMARAAKRALSVNTWTVNDPTEVRRLVELGVHGIIADDPAALRRAAGGG